MTKTPDRRVADAARAKRGGRIEPRLRRPAGAVYNFTQQLFHIVEELSRVYGSDKSIVDFDEIMPGTESIELISRRLLDQCVASFDERKFLVFCRVNAPRVGDYISRRIESEAWPLDADDILNDLFARVYRQILQAHPDDAAKTRGGALSSLEFTDSVTHYETLAFHADDIMESRVRWFESSRLPLPGLPVAQTHPPEFARAAATDLTTENGWRLNEGELECWASFALLRLSREERHLLLRREARRESLKEMAEHFACTSFEIGQRLKRAHEALRAEILRLVRAFSTEATPLGEEAHPDLEEPGHEPTDEESEHDD